MTVITSDIVPTHRPIQSPAIEAWLYTGQPITEWPDWVLSKMEAVHGPYNIPKPRLQKYALRDDEGYFWRWMLKSEFERRYEPTTD